MTPYKLKILNGVLKLKSFSDVVLNILGIKDLGTQTGNVDNGLVDWSIQHLTKTTAEWGADTTTILLKGQLGIEDTGNTSFKLKIGNGVDLWAALSYISGGGGSSTWGSITGTLSNQTDLQNELNLLVPYTGATQDVDLDDNGLDARFIKIKGTGGSGKLDLKHQSVDATAGGQDTALFAGSDGELYYKNDGLNVAQVASRDWVNSVNYNYYFLSSALINPADNTVYHLSFNFEVLALSEVVRQFNFDTTETIKELILTSLHANAGSNEDVTIYVRNITTATDYLVGTFKEDYTLNTSKTFKFSGLNIAVNDTDFWTIKILTPTWVTNPTNVRYGIRIKTI